MVGEFEVLIGDYYCSVVSVVDWDPDLSWTVISYVNIFIEPPAPLPETTIFLSYSFSI